MKRLYELLTLGLIPIGLIASGTIEKETQGHSEKEFSLQEMHDTTGLTGFIYVSSFNLALLPPSSGVQFYKDGILFLSNTKYEGKMLPKHVSFGSNEAYTAVLKDTSLGFHILFSPSSSFPFPCEATTFTSDYKTIYYTKIPKKERKEKIFRGEYKTAERGTGGWLLSDEPLEFCEGNYIYTHPAISADGKTLVFSSDMPGTLGGVDLFEVKLEGGRWSKPQNLGKGINTSKNECFPCLDADNNLYYSSDGLEGYGGYDIYTCKYEGDSWSNPLNLSDKVNNREDNIAFTIDRNNGTHAFYTSRPVSGNDGSRLFIVKLKENTYNGETLSISYIYNGKPGTGAELLAGGNPAQTEEMAKEPSVPVKTDTKTADEPAKVARTETKNPPANTGKSAETPSNSVKQASAGSADMTGEVLYRVQFLTASSPRKEDHVIINGITYGTWEYRYKNAYRYTVGKFTSLGPARQLQGILRKNGYPDAFVAAFVNNERSLDMRLFK